MTMHELEEQLLESRPDYHRAAFVEVGGEYELTGGWPLVQAVGDFDGIAFGFRAKHGEWTFETETSAGHLFPMDHPHYFIRQGTYDPRKPQALTLEWALPVLRKCCWEFWNR
jgi:hypothetical protein